VKEKLTVACVQAESALFDWSSCRGLSPTVSPRSCTSTPSGRRPWRRPA